MKVDDHEDEHPDLDGVLDPTQDSSEDCNPLVFCVVSIMTKSKFTPRRQLSTIYAQKRGPRIWDGKNVPVNTINMMATAVTAPETARGSMTRQNQKDRGCCK